MKKLTFGEALELLKQGKCVARSGWNGKGMCIFLNRGSHDFSNSEPAYPRYIDGVGINLFNEGHEGTVTRLPNINMKSATGSIVTGWLASQTDMLAEDWEDVSIAPSKGYSFFDRFKRIIKVDA